MQQDFDANYLPPNNISDVDPMDDFEIIWKHPKDLIPYEGNPRKITDAAVDAVISSLNDVGWQQPIVVDSDMVIIVGHVRRLAALKRGDIIVPVRIASHLTPEQITRYRIIDNKSGERATWDFSKLQVELKGTDLTHDVFSTSFTPLELDTILGVDFGNEPVPEIDEPDTKGKKGAPRPRYTITLDPTQWSKFQEAVLHLKEQSPDITDGDALASICEQWLTSV